MKHCKSAIEVYGEITVYILCKANSALLSIKDFIIAIITYNPIHYIERKSILDCINNSITLFVFVYKFTLIFRTNIEFSAKTHNAFFRIVFIVFYNLTYQYFV